MDMASPIFIFCSFLLTFLRYLLDFTLWMTESGNVWLFPSGVLTSKNGEIIIPRLTHLDEGKASQGLYHKQRGAFMVRFKAL